MVGAGEVLYEREYEVLGLDFLELLDLPLLLFELFDLPLLLLDKLPEDVLLPLLSPL